MTDVCGMCGLEIENDYNYCYNCEEIVEPISEEEYEDESENPTIQKQRIIRRRTT